MKVAIIGMGHVGRGFARAFARAGIQRARVASADVVILSVRDNQIAEAVSEIAPSISTRHVVLHTSGLLTSAILDPVKHRGAATGSLHPLLSFSNPANAAASIPGSTFAIEGSPRAIRAARYIARRLGARPILLRAHDKARYHVAAVFASNYVVAIARVACDIMASIGVRERRALEMLTPLTRGVVENLARGSVASALSGPIARGDVATVQAHLAAIRDPKHRAAYRALGRCVLPSARIPGRVSAALRRVLEDS